MRMSRKQEEDFREKYREVYREFLMISNPELKEKRRLFLTGMSMARDILFPNQNISLAEIKLEIEKEWSGLL